MAKRRAMEHWGDSLNGAAMYLVDDDYCDHKDNTSGELLTHCFADFFARQENLLVIRKKVIRGLTDYSQALDLTVQVVLKGYYLKHLDKHYEQSRFKPARSKILLWIASSLDKLSRVAIKRGFTRSGIGYNPLIHNEHPVYYEIQEYLSKQGKFCKSKSIKETNHN